MRTTAADVLPHLFAAEHLTVAAIAARLGVTEASVREVGDDLERVGMATIDGDAADPATQSIKPVVAGDCGQFEAMARIRGVDLDRELAAPERRRVERDEPV